MALFKTPTGIERTAQWEKKPVGGSVRSRISPSKRVIGQGTIDEEVRAELVKWFKNPRGKPFTTSIREFKARHPEFSHMKIDRLSDMAEAEANARRIPKNNLGKTKQGGARRMASEAERADVMKRIMRAIQDPKNKFKPALVAKAAGISRGLLINGFPASRFPLGLDSELQRQRLLHLWSTRAEHGMDLAKISKRIGRAPNRAAGDRDILVASEALSKFAGMHGRRLPVESIIRDWEELGGVALTLESLKGDSAKLGFLKKRGLIS